MSWKLINCVSGDVWALPPSLSSPPCLQPSQEGSPQDVNERRPSELLPRTSKHVSASPPSVRSSAGSSTSPASSPGPDDAVDAAFTVGRSPQCALRIADCGVSRLHGCFRVLPPCSDNVVLSSRDQLPRPRGGDRAAAGAACGGRGNRGSGLHVVGPSGVSTPSEASSAFLPSATSSLSSSVSASSSCVRVKREGFTATRRAPPPALDSENLVCWSTSQTGRVFFVDVSSSGTRRNGVLLRYPPELREAHRKGRLGGKNTAPAVAAEDLTGGRKWFELFDGDVIRFGQCPTDFVLRFFPLVFCLSTSSLPSSVAPRCRRPSAAERSDQESEAARRRTSERSEETNEETADTPTLNALVERGRWSGAYFLVDEWHPACCALLVGGPPPLPKAQVLGCLLANRPLLSPAWLPPLRPENSRLRTLTTSASGSPTSASGVSSPARGPPRGIYLASRLLEEGSSSLQSLVPGPRGAKLAKIGTATCGVASEAGKPDLQSSPLLAWLCRSEYGRVELSREAEGAVGNAGRRRDSEKVMCYPEAATDWRLLLRESGVASCVETERETVSGDSKERANREGQASPGQSGTQVTVLSDAVLPSAVLGSSELLKSYARQPLLIPRQDLLRDMVFLVACPRPARRGGPRETGGREEDDPKRTQREAHAKENDDRTALREGEPWGGAGESEHRDTRSGESNSRQTPEIKRDSCSLADVLRQACAVVLDFFAETPRHTLELHRRAASSVSGPAPPAGVAASSLSADMRLALSEALSSSESKAETCQSFPVRLARWICRGLRRAQQPQHGGPAAAGLSLFDMVVSNQEPPEVPLEEASPASPRPLDASLSASFVQSTETVSGERRRKRAFVLVVPSEAEASVSRGDTETADVLREILISMYIALAAYLCPFASSRASVSSRSSSASSSLSPFSDASVDAWLPGGPVMKQFYAAGEAPPIFVCSEQQLSLSILLGRSLFSLPPSVAPRQGVDSSELLSSNSGPSAASSRPRLECLTRLAERESFRRLREEAREDALAAVAPHGAREKAREEERQGRDGKQRQEGMRTRETAEERPLSIATLSRTPASQMATEPKTVDLTPAPRALSAASSPGLLPSSALWRASSPSLGRETTCCATEAEKPVRLVPVKGGALLKREGETSTGPDAGAPGEFTDVSPASPRAPFASCSKVASGGWQRKRSRGKMENERDAERGEARGREGEEADAIFFREKQARERMHARLERGETREEGDGTRPGNVKRFRKNRVSVPPGKGAARVSLAPLSSLQPYGSLSFAGPPGSRPPRRNESGEHEAASAFSGQRTSGRQGLPASRDADPDHRSEEKASPSLATEMKSF
ncbi:conserved hypothetical protein [Neospora caninum Liverpool]|uniref:FHA domain-containing protein n=1 Tax=Neospora caninum (strain Liverpool) TaxID=572307 RepID=F0V8P8_NEOCL|nr:conserved hypothetical protein [Neospora caninum Liverpool]CBZ50089.1 conserved hypothetical protein [Neospora caninum Liverpool]|eukprot:XP_003880124.1 conserved hypothetical protein [Neospora caninum Liverpool]